MTNYRSTLAFLAAILVVVVAVVIYLSRTDDKDPWASLPDKIKLHEDKLTEVAATARAGGDYQQAYAAVRDEWPELLGAISVDKNGNVYFVVSGNVFANVGFVCRQGDAPFLGDGFEPEIRETKHLFGQWWFYRG